MRFSSAVQLGIIAELLLHDGRSVRLLAAIYGLSVDPTCSLPVLQSLALDADLVGLVARLWIGRWDRGEYDGALQAVIAAEAAVPRASFSNHPTGIISEDELLRISDNIGAKVRLDLIADGGRLDDRISVANAICPFTIGVDQGSLAWVPDNDPPSKDERLVWVWVIRPDLGWYVRWSTADVHLRRAIDEYEGWNPQA